MPKNPYDPSLLGWLRFMRARLTRARADVLRGRYPKVRKEMDAIIQEANAAKRVSRLASREEIPF